MIEINQYIDWQIFIKTDTSTWLGSSCKADGTNDGQKKIDTRFAEVGMLSGDRYSWSFGDRCDHSCGPPQGHIGVAAAAAADSNVVVVVVLHRLSCGM